MIKLLKSFALGDMTARYVLNSKNRAVLFLTPSDAEFDLSSPKNSRACDSSSLAHLQLSRDDAGMFSNSFKLSETLDKLSYKSIDAKEDGETVTITTTEESDEKFGIRHILFYRKGEKGVEIRTEFYNNSEGELRLEYLTSVSLDALSPYLDNEGSKDMVFHRFKAGWSMEGLLQSDTLTRLGLEKAWGYSGESLKLGAIGSRPVREYHPYGALEDTKNNVIWGVYLAQNSSWQMELTRVCEEVSLSIGLADSVFGLWSKRIGAGESFTSPSAYVSTAKGGIAELSNRLLSMRHRAIDALGEKHDMAIAYNDYVKSWGNPTEKDMLAAADILRRGKTKYLIMDAGWYAPRKTVGDWNLNTEAFPDGLRAYCDKVKERGMIPGLWMEYERCSNVSKIFARDDLMVKKDGHAVVGHVINGGLGKFFDFSNPEAVAYLDEKVIKQLHDAGIGYLKVDYNASMGAGIDGDDSPGENLRAQMSLVREYFRKIRAGVPGIVIENCASGGCRLEPSMMDITEMSSASDTHEVYECAVVSANLHYLTPPRQNQIWATLHPEYSKERFSYIMSQVFLGRLCWSGDIAGLSESQLDELFATENFYEKVCHIIKRGDSYIYRTDECSFHSPAGTQAVVRYSEDKSEALVVVHRFRNAKDFDIALKGDYEIAEKLYPDGSEISGKTLRVNAGADFSGDVYLLRRV